MVGVRGNRKGRAKGVVGYIKSLTHDGEEMIDLMVKVMRGEPMPRVMKLPSGEEMTVEQTPTTETRMEAAEWLTDRAFGKPAQKIEGEIRTALAIVHRLPDHDPLATKPDDEERVLDVTPVPARRALRGRTT